MYPYEENACFWLILIVFLGYTLFNYFSNFKTVQKNVPLQGKCFFLTHFDCFPRKGTLFFQFFRFQNSKKGVPLRGKCMFLTHFDCFRRKGTLFLLSWKIVKKVYPYVENACFWLILIVFLVRVHFFYYFSDLHNSKKRCTLTRKMYVFDSFWLFSS